MDKAKYLIPLLALLLSLQAVIARVEYFGIDAQIIDDAHADIKFTIYKAKEFSFKFYGNIRNISSNVDCFAEGELIYCKSGNETAINVQIVSDIVARAGNTYNFNIQMELKNDVDRATSLVTLPIGMIIKDERDIFPSNFKTLSNGRNILVYWELENVSSTQPLSFRVKYQSVQPSPEIFSKFYLLIIILVIAQNNPPYAIINSML